MRRRELLPGALSVIIAARALAQPVPLGGPVNYDFPPGPTVSANRGSGVPFPPGVSLDLSFMTPGTLDPRITFTRASTATYTDASGTIQTAAVNAPRWDYDAVTHQLRGLLIEEARTNVLLNSAVLGTQSVAVTAQAYTLLFYGTGTVTKSGAATGTLVGTGASQRVSQTFTPTAGTLTLTVTGSVANAQLEAGSFPTSWIATAGASATRANDQPLLSTAGWFTAPGGSWFADCTRFANAASGFGRVIQNSSSDTGTPLFFDVNGALGQFDSVAFYVTGYTAAPPIATKCVSTWASPNLGKLCLNAGAIGSSTALSNGWPSLPGPVMIMQTANAADSLSGYIRRLTYWPRILTNAEMQQVTT